MRNVERYVWNEPSYVSILWWNGSVTDFQTVFHYLFFMFMCLESDIKSAFVVYVLCDGLNDGIWFGEIELVDNCCEYVCGLCKWWKFSANECSFVYVYLFVCELRALTCRRRCITVQNVVVGCGFSVRIACGVDFGDDGIHSVKKFSRAEPESWPKL